MMQLLGNPARDFQSWSRERTAWEHANQRWTTHSATQQPRFDSNYSAPSVLSSQTLSELILTGRQGNRWEAFHNTQAGRLDKEWIQAAMMELNQIDDEVYEEALPEIRSDTKDKARKIIFALMGQSIPPTVYPTMDGEIALYFKSPITTSSVLLLVGNDGQAACFSYINGKNRRARYEDATELPDEFVRAQLRALKESAFLKDT